MLGLSVQLSLRAKQAFVGKSEDEERKRKKGEEKKGLFLFLLEKKTPPFSLFRFSLSLSRPAPSSGALHPVFVFLLVFPILFLPSFPLCCC
jgi:hypothetical protein